MSETMRGVELFMTTFGQEVKDSPALPTEEIQELRVRLLREEVEELHQAFIDNDLVEVLDALTDIQYVLDGAYLACGLQHVAKAAFDEVQASNMSKLTKEGKVLRREDGKVMKSDQYFPPNLKKVLDRGEVISKGNLTAYDLRAAFNRKHIGPTDVLALLRADYITFLEYVYIIKV